MELRSLASRTDLIFDGFEGLIERHDDHVVVRTPSRPRYFWGNRIIYAHPPRSGDVDRWCAHHRRTFSADTEPTFMTFTWDAPGGARGALDPFVSRGFRVERCDVLTAGSAPSTPRRADPTVTVRRLTTDDDWEAAVDVHLGDWELDPSLEEPFVRSDLGWARRMADAGRGFRLGAFLGSRLVGDLGVYTGGVLGRFHSVATHRDQRRRGICSRLVHEASAIAFREMGVTRLVIVADSDSSAGRVYRSTGFSPSETQVALVWSDPEVYGRP